jgi:hypothetical protein
MMLLYVLTMRYMYVHVYGYILTALIISPEWKMLSLVSLLVDCEICH